MDHAVSLLQCMTACTDASKRRPFLVPALLLLIVVSSFGGAALAATRADCGVRFGTFIDTGGTPGGSSAICAGSRSVGTDSVSGTADASADIGSLHASASIAASTIIEAESEAHAAWFDTMTLQSGGVDEGTSVQVLIGFAILGSLTASDNALASFGLRLGVCGDNAFCAPNTGVLSGTVTATSGDSTVGTVVERLVNVRVGQLTGLSMQLDVSATKLETPGQPTSGSADVNFTNSAYWDGIREVRLNGVVIPYSITTGSGIDLTQSLRPVPVPAAVWLFGSALLVGLRRRAQR
ncbi:MAG: hypothetical protein AB7I32_15385 [Gammaproteobacteria bacterium]